MKEKPFCNDTEKTTAVLFFVALTFSTITIALIFADISGAFS